MRASRNVLGLLRRRGGIGIVAFMSFSVAYAETPWIYSGSVTAGVEHDSNPVMSPTSRGSVVRERLSPEANARYVGATDEFNLGGGVWAEHSSRQDLSPDRADPHVRAEWRRSTPLSTYSLFASGERRAYRTLEVEERAPTAVDGSRTLLSVGGAWSRSLSPVTSVATDVRHEQVSYSAGAIADYQLTAGSAQLSQALDARSSWFAFVGGQRFRADPTPGVPLGSGTSSTSSSVSLGYRRVFSPELEIEASAGVVLFGGAKSATSSQGTARATYNLNKLQLSAEVARRVAPSPLNSSLGLITVIRLQAQYAVDEKTAVAADVSQSRLQAAQDSRWTQLSLAFTRELSRSWRMGLRLASRVREDTLGNAHGTLVAMTLTYSLADF